MAVIHWLKTVSGAFSDTADWSGGAVPGPDDDAILDAPGSTDYTVSATSNVTVTAIQTAANALLDIDADFTATGGTGPGVNAGAIRVENGHSLTLQGTVDNTGSIEIFGTVSTTTIVLGNGGVTLTGGGAVFLNFTGGKYQQIIPAPGGSILTLSQRISGQGLIGGAGLTIISEADGGFLEAKGGLLTINTGAHTIANAGQIDAEGAPGYPYVPGQGVVESPVNNSGFVEADGVGSTMTFDEAVTGSGRAVILGGTLRFDAGFDQTVTFENTSGVLVLAQSMNYTSTIDGFSQTGGDFLDLRDIDFVNTDEATYSGTASSGVLTISDGTHTAHIHFEGNYISSAFTASSDGNGGTLITAGSKAIDWRSASNGTFQTAANWTGGFAPGPNNDAVLDAAGGAPYVVTASSPQTIEGLQSAANAHLVLSAAMTISDGTDGGIAAGQISLASNGRLTISGTFDDPGGILLSAPTGLSELVVAGATTITGGNAIYMGDKAASAITGESPSAVLTNVDQLIAGAGTLGLGGLTLINETAGRILSDVAGKMLVINTGANTIVNAGLLEGGGGGMRVMSAVENDGVVRALTALTFSRSVTGSGSAVIDGGALRFLAGFDQGVTFEGAGGVLGLTYSRSYDATVNGFARTGADALDLTNIEFAGATKATYSGGASSGTLTVTDGTHTAHIHLHGNYTGVTFTVAADGQGGTIVSDTTSKPRAQLHAFITAMAGHADGSVAPITFTPDTDLRLATLASPR